MSGEDRPAVRLSRLTRIAGGSTILRDVSLDIAHGEFVALIGKSGSGKSTLLRAIAELDDDIDGSGVVEAPEGCSILFQDSRLLPWLSALENITLGLRHARPEALARQALEDVGLKGRENAWPAALSGGEQQRVALARSLVREPELLLADEPFGALDALTRIRMHELLYRLFQQHRPAVLLVTHDVDEALLLADRVLVMEAGRIVVDRRIEIAHPRHRSAGDFPALRAELLAALGVVETV